MAACFDGLLPFSGNCPPLWGGFGLHRGVVGLPAGLWSAASAPVPLGWAARREVRSLLALGSGSAIGGDVEKREAGSRHQAEADMAAHTGFKFCVATNSYGSALFLALKAIGVVHGDQVLGSSLSTQEVPSAVQHAGATFVEVGNTPDLDFDVRDLAWKADKFGARYLVLSHDGGHVADVDDVARVCGERGIVVLEACAHSLGAWWEGRHVGHHGVVCCFSAGLDTLLRVGEGGFVATDDVVVAAGVAAMAGAYDSSFRRRFAAPEASVFREIDQGHFPNFSLEMPNLIAAVVKHEIPSLDKRAVEANRRHALLSGRFLAQAGDALRSSTQLRVPRPHAKARECLTSFRFSVALAPPASLQLLAAAHARGVPLRLGLGAAGAAGAVEEARGTALRQTCELFIPPGLRARHCVRAADLLIASLTEASSHCPTGPSKPLAPPGFSVAAQQGFQKGPTTPRPGPEGPLVALEGTRVALSAVPEASQRQRAHAQASLSSSSQPGGFGFSSSVAFRVHARPSSRAASESSVRPGPISGAAPAAHAGDSSFHRGTRSTASVSFPLDSPTDPATASTLPRVATVATAQTPALTSSFPAGGVPQAQTPVGQLGSATDSIGGSLRGLPESRVRRGGGGGDSQAQAAQELAVAGEPTDLLPLDSRPALEPPTAAGWMSDSVPMSGASAVAQGSEPEPADLASWSLVDSEWEREFRRPAESPRLWQEDPEVTRGAVGWGVTRRGRGQAEAGEGHCRGTQAPRSPAAGGAPSRPMLPPAPPLPRASQSQGASALGTLGARPVDSGGRPEQKKCRRRRLRLMLLRWRAALTAPEAALSVPTTVLPPPGGPPGSEALVRGPRELSCPLTLPDPFLVGKDNT